MFGLIPRTVWSRSVPTDDKGRITVRHNCLLLERSDGVAAESRPGTPPALPGPRRVLIEAGTGDKLDAKMRSVFELELNSATGRPRTIEDALLESGASPESIDAAIVTHLHFDHAGGLTRLPREGEVPEFAFDGTTDGGGGSAQAGGCRLTLPRAEIVCQAREWADARANRSVMTRTYFADHLTPIESRLRLLDSPRPFPVGYVPGRDELPPVPVCLRQSEPWPGLGIAVFLVPGHTWGQQAVKFVEPPPPVGRGRTIVFTPDVLPTVHHAGAAYSLGYDVEPYTSMVSRRWLLTEAAAADWVLCLDHEPEHPLFRVREDGRGWFRLEPERL